MKHRTGIAERLAVRLFAESRGLPLAERRDGIEWARASESVREEFRSLAKVSIRFLSDLVGGGPVSGPACDAARAVLEWEAYLDTLDDDARDVAETCYEVGRAAREKTARTVFDLVKQAIELEPADPIPTSGTGPARG